MINTSPKQDLGIFVVVPCYNESKVEALLQSLEQCEAPDCSVEILVLINEHAQTPIQVKETNAGLFHDLQMRPTAGTPSWMTWQVVHLKSMPVKHAGVGLARRLAMDEGLRRFRLMGMEGLIVNIDADCTCAPNYLREIQKHFRDHPSSWAAGVHFEHALDSAEIISYELHLRYFIQAQQHAGLPFAFQTLGSCMVVRSEAYDRMGGMNKRQAGEDFYFLQKFIEIGRFTEISTTTVFPSSRTSDRVPFGTGKAIRDIRAGQPQMTYQLRSILSLTPMIASLPELFHGRYHNWVANFDPVLKAYLASVNAEKRIAKIGDHTASLISFRQKYLQWFNAFRVMKYLHFARDTYPDQPVLVEASVFYTTCTGVKFKGSEPELLLWFRDCDRKKKPDV